jgi:hypothetical protein
MSIGTVRIIRVVFLEDEVFEGTIAHECYENARTEDFEVDDIEEAVHILKRESLTFEASGSDWASDPDGSRITNYATAERTETSGHLKHFRPLDVEAIIARVG